MDKVKGIKFLQRNLSMIKDDLIRHDPSLVASSIIELICDDLRYQDKQNDPQYLMLSNKLREEKRINKVKKKTAKKELKAAKEGKGRHEAPLKSKSKFSSKYSDRIASIREADKKAEVRAKQREQKEKTKNRKNKTSRKKNDTTKASSVTRKKSPQEIREEMLEQLKNSKLNDRK